MNFVVGDLLTIISRVCYIAYTSQWALSVYDIHVGMETSRGQWILVDIFHEFLWTFVSLGEFSWTFVGWILVDTSDSDNI